MSLLSYLFLWHIVYPFFVFGSAVGTVLPQIKSVAVMEGYLTDVALCLELKLGFHSFIMYAFIHSFSHLTKNWTINTS